MSTIASSSTWQSNKPLLDLSLTSALMSKFKPAKIVKNAVEQPKPQSPGSKAALKHHQISGMSYDDSGNFLVTASDDDIYRVWNCKSGTSYKMTTTKKYGVDLPRFTHNSSTVLFASTKVDDAIRYHSLHENRFLRYFKGHNERVVSLEMSPCDDTFLSGSIDRTVRLWDLRSPTCRGLLHLPSSPVVAYDSTGVVFAVALNTFCRIMLYDMQNYDKEPFFTMTLEDPTLKLVSFPPRQIFITSLGFSSDGKYLLVGTSGNAHYIMDAFEGHLLAKLEGHIGLERVSPNGPVGLKPVKGISGEEVNWTPDSKFITGGSVDGKICIWDAQSLPSYSGQAVDLNRPPRVLQPVTVLDGHPGPSRCVKFNPKYLTMLSAGNELAFWLPDLVGDGSDEVRQHFKNRFGGGA